MIKTECIEEHAGTCLLCCKANHRPGRKTIVYVYDDRGNITGGNITSVEEYDTSIVNMSTIE